VREQEETVELKAEAVKVACCGFCHEAFCQELVELRLVLCVPQPIKEIAEVALLLFEQAQSLGALLVKGAIAAGPRIGPPVASNTHLAAHAVHFLVRARHLALPLPANRTSELRRR
jgi:hypothetical protein